MGRLNWIEIPAGDIEQTMRFYQVVFGWTVDLNEQDADYPMFTDSSGNVGGAFVTWREPSDDGYLPYIAVASIEETMRAVDENGGALVKEKTAIVEGKDWFAIARDPAGNLIGLYEEVPS